MTKRTFMVLALAASLMVVGVYAAPSTPAKAKGVTVGDFAVKVAAALQYDVSTPQIAASALERRGITLASDLNTPMTQGDAARVMPRRSSALAAICGVGTRSEEHTSELQSLRHLVFPLLL